MLPGELLYQPSFIELGDFRSTEIGCKTNKKRNSTWFVDLLVSPDLAMRDLSAKSAQGYAYLNAREETEFFSNAYSATARVSYLAESGVAIRGGLEFSQITEKLDYVNDDVQTITVVFPVDTIFNGTNMTIVFDTTVHILGVNGGVFVNIDSWQRGQFLQPDTTDIVTFETGTPGAYDAFKTNVGLSLALSVSGTYEFADGMSLVIEPKYRHFLKPHTIESYELEQRYRTFGVYAGIRFRLK